MRNWDHKIDIVRWSIKWWSLKWTFQCKRELRAGSGYKRCNPLAPQELRNVTETMDISQLIEWELNQSCLAIRVWGTPVDKWYLCIYLLSPSHGNGSFPSLVLEIPCSPVFSVVQDTSIINLLEGENNGRVERAHGRIYIEGYNYRIFILGSTS